MRWFPLIVLTALFSIFLMGCDRILYGEGTHFAKGYSERKFRQIKQGMATQDVVSVLSPPLSQSTLEWSEIWFYSPRGMQPSVTRTKDGATIFSNFFGGTNVQFTQTGTVMAVSGKLDTNFVGLTKEQVLAKVGEPSRRALGQFEMIYHYTAPGKRGTGTYKKREVRFDASNKVSRVVAVMYYD